VFAANGGARAHRPYAARSVMRARTGWTGASGRKIEAFTSAQIAAMRTDQVAALNAAAS